MRVCRAAMARKTACPSCGAVLTLKSLAYKHICRRPRPKRTMSLEEVERRTKRTEERAMRKYLERMAARAGDVESPPPEGSSSGEQVETTP